MKPLSHIFPITLLAVLLAGTALSTRPVPQARADGPVITVNTVLDSLPPPTSGECSLREAIRNANNNAATYPDCAAGTGNDTIVFADGVGTILLNADLPTITDPDGLTIDGRNVTIHGNYIDRIFYVNSVPLTLQNINLFGADTVFFGGAVINYGGALTVTNSVFYFNQAREGGAIYSDNGTLTVANSLFLENFSDIGDGGAVKVVAGTATLTNNTFGGNHATAGGDLYVSGSTVSLVNNIFANGGGGGNCERSGGTVIGHHNLFQDATSTCGLTAANGNITGYDPQFVQLPDPANNVSGDYSLRPTSPAIDAGDNAACASGLSYNGLPRPQGNHCDIGAYEYPQTLVRKYIVSTAAQDGWVLESTATSSVGGSRSSAGSTIPIGDTAQKQQRVGIFSFDIGATGGLPAPQDLVSVSLWLKPAGYCGTTSPFPSLGNLLVDVRKGSFANNLALQAKDFQALATKKAAWSLDGTLTDGWLMKQLSPADFQLLNWSGVTQLRVRFAKGNNSNARADCLKIYSSEEPTHLMQPQLVVDYYVR
jgi:hypothetical protein